MHNFEIIAYESMNGVAIDYHGVLIRPHELSRSAFKKGDRVKVRRDFTDLMRESRFIVESDRLKETWLASWYLDRLESNLARSIAEADRYRL